jgi:hypothetical protein
VNKTVIEFRVDQRQESAHLLSQMRRGVRKVAGPDVDFAFTGRRSG